MSARIAGVHWCEGPSEREEVSASHLLHSSRGQKNAHERKENYTCTRPPVVAREGFREQEPQIQSIVKLRDGMETEQDRESGDQDSSLGFATCILWGAGRVPSPPSRK